ncbi:MAG: three-Cys-motif partner protein TcmP, partial [Candidatus Binatia bacterium]
AALFGKSMAKKWHHRVYIGLYAGAGRAALKDTGEIVETSALGVIRQEAPFTKYIFVDADPKCLGALEERIEAVPGEFDVSFIRETVNDSVAQVEAAIPRFDPAAGEGLLALCFVDPFRADLDFSVIQRISRYRVDFLVMLPLGFDLRRNLRRYLDNAEDDRVAALIDCPGWREEWKRYGKSDRHFVRFVLEKFDEAMEPAGISAAGDEGYSVHQSHRHGIISVLSGTVYAARARRAVLAVDRRRYSSATWV